ncbi:MAG: 16S rRNA (cytosine(1402)-N(4))-methyltransferase RsmH [Candidatus Pacebacteria bacterium]|nr:16S rRNA (cytosine(1402)-N(4))-methyltransferase RsmH [Candidatus Paceibacterota bacterium]
MPTKHIPVLLQETLEGLDLHPGDRVFEGTVGLGGHTEEILKRIGEKGIYIGVDQDSQALAQAEKRLKSYKVAKIFREENFRNLDRVLDETQTPLVDKILFDIGLSNLQLEESGRGFSFKRDEPLLMTFKTSPKGDDLTAKEIVNEWGKDSLADIIRGYGEDRFADRIANAIVAEREIKPIETTNELASIVTTALPPSLRHGRIHPATKTFQALRIAVNDELGALRQALAKGFERLAPRGRMAVVSFHSLEDRIVKNFFKDLATRGLGITTTKKPISPGEEELEKNPKSRSAKLRIIKKN